MLSTADGLPFPRRSPFDDFASMILCQAHTGGLEATARGGDKAATFGEGVTSLCCQTSSKRPRNASAVADVFSCPANSSQGMAIGDRVVNSSASSFPPSGRMSFLSTHERRLGLTDIASCHARRTVGLLTISQHPTYAKRLATPLIIAGTTLFSG